MYSEHCTIVYFLESHCISDTNIYRVTNKGWVDFTDCLHFYFYLKLFEYVESNLTLFHCTTIIRFNGHSLWITIYQSQCQLTQLDAAGGVHFVFILWSAVESAAKIPIFSCLNSLFTPEKKTILSRQETSQNM